MRTRTTTSSRSLSCTVTNSPTSSPISSCLAADLPRILLMAGLMGPMVLSTPFASPIPAARLATTLQSLTRMVPRPSLAPCSALFHSTGKFALHATTNGGEVNTRNLYDLALGKEESKNWGVWSCDFIKVAKPAPVVYDAIWKSINGTKERKVSCHVTLKKMRLTFGPGMVHRCSFVGPAGRQKGRLQDGLVSELSELHESVLTRAGRTGSPMRKGSLVLRFSELRTLLRPISRMPPAKSSLSRPSVPVPGTRSDAWRSVMGRQGVFAVVVDTKLLVSYPL
jgi:hypothetical protein